MTDTKRGPNYGKLDYTVEPIKSNDKSMKCNGKGNFYAKGKAKVKKVQQT